MSSPQQPWDWAVKEMAWWECPLYLDAKEQDNPFVPCWLGPPLVSGERFLGAELALHPKPPDLCRPFIVLSLPQTGKAFNGF